MEPVAEVAKLHAVANDAANLVLAELPAAEWLPNEESLAFRDLNNVELGRSKEPWGPQPVETAHGYVLMVAMSAIDHLGAIVSCTQYGDASAFAPWSLARAVLEQSSLAWWALEPEVSVRERVARGMAIRLRGLRDRAKALELIDSDEAQAEASAAADRVRQVLHEARRLRLPTQNQDRRTVGLKVGIPKKSDRSVDILDAAGVGDTRGIYQYLSSLAHGEGFLVERVTIERAPANGEPGYVSPRLTMAETAFVIGISALAVIELAKRLVPYFGFKLSDNVTSIEKQAHRMAQRLPPLDDTDD